VYEQLKSFKAGENMHVCSSSYDMHVSSSSYEQLKSFKAGENIVQRGDDVQTLCVLVEGAATVQVRDAMEGDAQAGTCVRAYLPGASYDTCILLLIQRTGL
jgi:CRP-like cAMP-binding protein